MSERQCPACERKHAIDRKCWTAYRHPPNDERIANALEKILILLHKHLEKDDGDSN